MSAGGGKRLLFVTYGGGHAHMIYPVVHALRAAGAFKQGSIIIDVLGLPAATYTLNNNGIDCLRFDDGPVVRIALPHKISSGTHSVWADRAFIRDGVLPRPS